MVSLRELWVALRSSDDSEIDGDLRMRLCYSSGDLHVFGAVSGPGSQAAIVIEIAKELLPQNLAVASGRRLSLIAAELPGLPSGRGAVVVQLKDEQFEDLFEQLGSCLLDEIRTKNSPAEAVHAAVRQIERWRRFLERRREILSPEEVRGLIGELAILERLIFRIGAHEAIRSWKAPSGSIRDFECSDVSIEVKTFMTSTGASVRINDPLQLEPEQGVPLLLACQELARSQQAECMLPGHIARIVRLLSHDIALVEEFENVLAMAGYLGVHADLYIESYAVGTTHAMEVRDGFPRICPADVPPHVVGVQFSLEVLPLTRFEVDSDSWIGQKVLGDAER